MAPRTHRGVVFVTDDEDAPRDSVQDLLEEEEEEGYLVLSARDGTVALARMRGISGPALAIVDLVMPGMDAWDLIKTMRANAELHRIPIVLLSGQRREPIEGADRILPKPYAPKVLLGLVNELCR